MPECRQTKQELRGRQRPTGLMKGGEAFSQLGVSCPLQAPPSPEGSLCRKASGENTYIQPKAMTRKGLSRLRVTLHHFLKLGNLERGHFIFSTQINVVAHGLHFCFVPSEDLIFRVTAKSRGSYRLGITPLVTSLTHGGLGSETGNEPVH